MSKTKIEELAEKYGVNVEIVINKGLSEVLIYNDKDIYIKTFRSRSLNEALSEAVQHYLKNNK